MDRGAAAWPIAPRRYGNSSGVATSRTGDMSPYNATGLRKPAFGLGARLTTDPVKTAELLGRARLDRQRVRLPAALRPRSMAEAYDIQAAIGMLLGAPASAPAWKVGAPNAAAEPTAAPIYDVRASPARVDPAAMTMHGVEAEIAVVFGRPLPPRVEPYAEAEVMAAVADVRVAIELCDSRIDDWESADDATRLADHQLNVALVLGDRCTDWRAIDFTSVGVLTQVGGTLIARGTGCHAVGNPLLLLPWLANHARARGGIGAGTAVTTGAWLGLHRVAPDATVRVEFAGLGSAEVAFTRA